MPLLASFFTSSLFTIVALVTIVVLYAIHQRSYWKKRGVNTIPGHWLFGNVKDAIFQRRSFAHVFGDLYRQASETDDVLGIYIFCKPFLILKNPELIKQILIKDFHIFPDRYFSGRSFHDDVGTKNLFSLKNPEWRYLRTKLSPVFTSIKLKNFYHLIVQNAESMSKYLEGQFSNGKITKSINLKDVALKYATDIISNVAFGVQVNSFDPDQGEFFRKVQEGLKFSVKRGIQFATMFFFPSISPFVGIQMLGSSTNYFRKVFWDSMDAREMSKVKRGDLIDLLVDLKNENQDNSAFKLKGDTLVSQSAIFFVAGRESTVTTICFTLFELAKHPEIQRRTREEILQKLEEHGMTYEGVQSMKYLHQVISETLRLYPPAPILERVALQNYKIPGSDIVIEKGTPVYIPLMGLQQDPKYFSNPLTYNPDRYTNGSKDYTSQGTYIPFGEGPRNCIGMRLGQLQSAIGVLTVLKDYKVTIDPTCRCGVDTRNIFLSPTDDFRLNLIKLNDTLNCENTRV